MGLRGLTQVLTQTAKRVSNFFRRASPREVAAKKVLKQMSCPNQRSLAPVAGFASPTPQSPIEQHFRFAMSECLGLRLLNAPADTGKTETVKRVARDCLEGGQLSGATYIDCRCHVGATDLIDILDSEFGLDSGEGLEVLACVGASTTERKPALVIFDHFESLAARIPRNTVNLATTAYGSSSIIPVFVLEDPDLTREMWQLNDNQKIATIPYSLVNGCPLPLPELQPTPAYMQKVVENYELDLVDDLAHELQLFAEETRSVGFVARAAARLRALTMKHSAATHWSATDLQAGRRALDEELRATQTWNDEPPLSEAHLPLRSAHHAPPETNHELQRGTVISSI